MTQECIDCGRETENTQWIDGQYVRLCFGCEEQRERAAQRSILTLLCHGPTGRDGAIVGVMRSDVMHLAGHLCTACKDHVEQENERAMKEYERLCAVAERQAQEFLRDCFVL